MVTSGRCSAALTVIVALAFGTGLRCTAHADTWSLLALVVADGNLAAAGESYCENLLSAAEEAEWSIALQLDNGTDHLTRKVLREGQRHPVSRQLRSVDYRDADQLAEYFRWATENAPAEHYAVVVFGHSVSASGAAWDGARGGTWPAVAIDGTSGVPLRPTVFGDALIDAVGRKADVVVLDCCYGASMEVSWGLRHSAEVIIAWPGKAPISGLPWSQMLDGETPLDPAAVVRTWAEPAGDTVAIRTKGLREVVRSVRCLSAAIGSSIDLEAPALTQARSECSAWGWEDEMCDLHDLCTRLADVADGRTAIAAARVADAVDSCVISDHGAVTVPFATGLHAEEAGYLNGGFGEVSKWDDMINAYHDRQQKLMRRTLVGERHDRAAIARQCSQ